MKRIIKFSVMALAVATTGLLNSCTKNDALVPDENVQTIQLLKAPDVHVYSGKNVWGSTLTGTRANAGDGWIGNPTWAPFDTDALENITDEERQAVLAAIAAKVTGEKISENVVFPWKNYFLQDVISGQNGRFKDAGSSGTPSSSYQFEAWNTGADCRKQSQWNTDNHTDDFSNYECVSNSAHLNSYFQKQNADGTQTRIEETALMTDMTFGTYEEMAGKQFRWYINCHENLHWYEYITVEVNGSWYICFDFACGHLENDKDGNPGKGSTPNDWDYNDWIIKITPAVASGETVPDVWTGTDPETPEEPEEPETPETPAEPTDEVEINLSVNEHNDYLESKLSIHVRAATDVEVFIPIEEKYYIQKDDMDIIGSHFKEEVDNSGNLVYGGNDYTPKMTIETHEYQIDGHIVSLTVAYEGNGIRITTDGIDKDVIDYCREYFHDGITFEVWNYFNNEIGEPAEIVDRDILKSYLDNATVKFLDKTPDLYVNAFNKTKDGEKFDYDCNVRIVEDQRSEYDDVVEVGEHLNGSTYNHLYHKKAVAE